jgi:hypothetical protein
MKHKHADLIHAWADGAEIEVFVNGHWTSCVRKDYPDWHPILEYRIKPKEKKPVVRWLWAYQCNDDDNYWTWSSTFMTEQEVIDLEYGEAIKLEWSRTEFPE